MSKVGGAMESPATITLGLAAPPPAVVTKAPASSMPATLLASPCQISSKLSSKPPICIGANACGYLERILPCAPREPATG